MLVATRWFGFMASAVMPLNALVTPLGVMFVHALCAIWYFQIEPALIGSLPPWPFGPAPLAYVTYSVPFEAITARCGICVVAGARGTALQLVPPLLLM